MAEFKTRTDLTTEALGLLTGLDPSQEPGPEELGAIDAYVEPLLAQLAADNIIYIADAGEIPNEFFLPIARLLANVAGPRFGSPMNEDARLRDEGLLMRLNRGNAPSDPVYVDHF